MGYLDYACHTNIDYETQVKSKHINWARRILKVKSGGKNEITLSL